MKLFYFLVFSIFINRPEPLPIQAQGTPVVTNDLIINGKPIKRVITGGNISTPGGTNYVNDTTVPSTKEIKTYVDSLINSIGPMPVIPTNISAFTNDVPYLITVPAQSFSSLIGIPTTLSGYGITDAYPLGSNPSNFLTGITSGQVTTALTYTPLKPTDTTSLSNRINGKLATGTTTSSIAEGSNLYFTTARAQSSVSLTTTGAGGATYSAGVFNIPVPNTYIPTISSVTRTVNSATYTPSAMLQATLIYNISISCTASIGSNSSGTVTLQYSTNAGSTWTTAGTITNSNTVTLALALNLINLQTGTIIATIPVGALCKLVPSTTGTTTITFISGQEIY